MDSRMIDVAIGLVLVFALTGLAVTTLHEIWATLRKSRAMNLERAVHSMLGDGFSDDVLAHPLIASLAVKPTIGTGKPSYMSADVLVTALVAQLTRLYCAGTRPDTPSELIAAAQRGRGKLAVREPSQALLDVMSALLAGTEADWVTYQKRLCAWYDSVGERSIGWFKRDTNMRLFVLGFGLAVVVNINPFVIAPRLWNDKALRDTAAQMARQAQAAYADASGTSTQDGSDVLLRVLAAMQIPKTGGQATAGHPAVEAELDARLDTFTRSAIAVANAQSDRGDVRVLGDLQRLLEQTAQVEKIVKLRRSLALADDQQGIQNASESIKHRLGQIGTLLAGDPAGKQAASGLAGLSGAGKDALQSDFAELETAARGEARRLTAKGGDAGLCTEDLAPDARLFCQQLSSLTGGLASAGLPVGWTAVNLPDCANGPCVLELLQSRQQKAKSAARATDTPKLLQGNETAGAAKMCLNDVDCVSVSLLGWTITGLAAMLGAPFWFDLLGKLIKVRGAGTKPSDNAPGAAAAQPGTEPASLLSTPNVPPAEIQTAMRDVQTPAEARLTPGLVRELQTSELHEFGAESTGYFDEKTRQAITAWQRHRGDSVTGELTKQQIETLLASSTGRAANATADTEEHVDGCNSPVTHPTEDTELEPARGGVAAG